MEKTDLHHIAKIAFSSEFSFYLKAHQFHWNVTGQNFRQYHDLFGTIYEEVYGSIDDFAEKIRSLGTFMPGSYTRFSMLSKIEDEERILSDGEMIKELYQDNEKMIVILNKLYEASEASNTYGFSNFVAERIDAHAKHGWQLKAVLS
jgi:starvation-inducible DNA-binding protein